MEEVNLAKKAIKGDAQAFEDLIELYQNSLYRIAYNKCKHEEDAKEVLQETLYRAYKNIGGLREPSYFKTWITRILINVANDYLKKHGMVDLELNEADFVKEEVVEDRIEIKIDVLNAMDELDIKYKDAFSLRYIEDLKIEEISKILDRPVNTIKTHIRKAIKDMRNLLKEGYENEE